MKKIIALVMTLCMLLALCACGSTAPKSDPAPATQSTAQAEPEKKEEPAPKFEFKMSIAQGATDPTATYSQQFIDEVSEKTNGNVTIELHVGGELGSINEVNELIAQGAAMINYTGSDGFTATNPELAILNSQYCLSDPDQMDKLMASDWYKGQIEQLAEKGNVRLLTLNWFTGFRHFATKFSVETLADFSGKNMRVADSAAAIAFAKAIGTSPVVTTKNEVYTGMSNGMLDCFENPLNGILSGSYNEVADYVVLTKHLVSCGGICMNEQIFQSMPEAYQQAILEAAVNAGLSYKEYSLSSEAAARAALEEKGMTIVEFSPEAMEEFKTAASAMYEDSSLGFSKDLYDTIQAIIK